MDGKLSKNAVFRGHETCTILVIMYLTYQTVPDGIAIKIHGELSRLDIPVVRRAISDFRGLPKIILDLSELSFLESSFAGALFEIRGSDPELAGRMEIVHPNDTVAETMHIMKLDSIYPVNPKEASI